MAVLAVAVAVVVKGFIVTLTRMLLHPLLLTPGLLPSNGLLLFGRQVVDDVELLAKLLGRQPCRPVITGVSIPFM